MADQNYNIDIGITDSGDGAEKSEAKLGAVEKSAREVGAAAEESKVTIDELKDSLALAKVESEKLTAAANAAVAKDGKTDENRDLRKSAYEARAAYEDLTRTVNAFYEANGQGLEQMKTGYDEHIANLAETQAAQKAVTLAKQEELKVENELRDARREAEKRARKSLKPKAKINQIDDSAIGSVRGIARVKRYGRSLVDLGKKGLRVGAIFTVVWKGFGILGKKMQSAGKGIQDFAKDMEDSNAAGAGFVAWIGRSTEAIGNWLSFASRYKEAQHELAEANRMVAEADRQWAKERKKSLVDAEKARAALVAQTDASDKYTASLNSRISGQASFNQELARTNRYLQRQKNLVNKEDGQKRQLLDAAEEKQVAEVEAGGGSDEKKVKAIEAIRDKFHRARLALDEETYQKKKAIIEREIKASEIARKKERDRLKGLKELDQSTFTEDEVKEYENRAENLEKILKNKLIERNSGEGSPELDAEIDFLKKEIKSFKGLREKNNKRLNDADFKDAGELETVKKQLQDKIDALTRKLERQTNAETDLENERVVDRQISGFKNKARDLNKKSKRKKSTEKKIKELEKKIKNLELEAGKKIQESVGEISKANSNKATKKNLENTDKKAGDGAGQSEIQEALKLVAEAVQSKGFENQVGKEMVGQLKQQAAEIRKNSAEQKKLLDELKQFKQLYKNNQ